MELLGLAIIAPFIQMILNPNVETIFFIKWFEPFFNTNNHANKIYLTGGSSNLLGLKDFISTSLNSDVELLDPFEKITLNETLDNPYEYSVAVGCALRGLKK